MLKVNAAARGLGVFLRADLLDPALCRRIVSATDVEAGQAAQLYGPQSVDTGIRHAREHDIPDLAALVQEQIDAVRGDLGRWFSCALGTAEPVSFVAYGAGQFYRPHVDRGPDARGRLVSAVVFLNSGEFTGGELVVYDLVDDPRWRGVGLPVVPEAGMLAAFPSDRLHEVRTVAGGRRCVAVTWFHGKRA